jgi:hypothetical protein
MARDVLVGFLVGAGVVAALLVGRATLTASPPPAGSAMAEPRSDAELAAPPAPSTLTEAATEEPIPADKGRLVPPAAAKGHRVYVDGRQVGEGTDPIIVPCGRHVVRIGSSGRDQALAIPCGEEIWVE